MRHNFFVPAMKMVLNRCTFNKVIAKLAPGYRFLDHPVGEMRHNWRTNGLMIFKSTLPRIGPCCERKVWSYKRGLLSGQGLPCIVVLWLNSRPHTVRWPETVTTGTPMQFQCVMKVM